MSLEIKLQTLYYFNHETKKGAIINDYFSVF